MYLLSFGCNGQQPDSRRPPIRLPIADAADAESGSIVKQGPQVESYRRGMNHVAHGEYELAIEQFNKTIELDNDFSLAHYSRGQTHDKLGNIEAAMADLDRAIELDPQETNYHYSRGVLLVALGRYERAIADYDRELELTPDDADAIVARGVCWDKWG